MRGVLATTPVSDAEYCPDNRPPYRGAAIGLLANAVVCSIFAAVAEAGSVSFPNGTLVPKWENASMTTAHTAQPISYMYTLRVTFSYDGSKLEITRVQRVAMRAPAPASTPPQESQAGYWFEVRDDKGALIYHRPIHDPMRSDIESFGDAPGQPIRRHPARTAKGEFELLIPDLPGAQTFRLHGPTSSEARAALAPSVSVSEHSFDELHELARRDSGQGGAR